MMPYERGYADFLKGVAFENNPFDDSSPWSMGKWVKGWLAAKARKMERMV